MDTLQRLAIEAECSRLMTTFSLCTDTFDYDRALGLFVPDCTFQRADEVFEGLDGLRFVLNRRNPERITRHIVSNMLIDVKDETTATGQAYALVFGHVGALDENGEAPLGAPDSLVIFNGGFTRTDEGWRIKTWRIDLSFRRKAA
ncbi:nuclear transport factor 2 family protein [Salipiger abyssi]|uniref:nuclear transport factor 2 family protein n=1 Tax=Salipiger abyssi TaxID=1250539 RepID=UPI001A9089BC|nr:nuclear transport factor 2 family protein [Salipiger abyssi]MBN9888320.1 nuclear transport factor 2 family protein [Salipiger abyssi]